MEFEVAKKSKKKIVRREYTKADVKELRAHSKAKTPLAKIVKLTKRTEGSLRQKALKLGIRLGHQLRAAATKRVFAGRPHSVRRRPTLGLVLITLQRHKGSSIRRPYGGVQHYGP